MHQLKRNLLQRNLLLFMVVVALAIPNGVWAQADMFDGKPVFAEGVDLGYYVWREGDTWYVRWTTRGTMRRFSGVVEAEGGELKSLKRIDVEEKSRVVAPGRAPRVVVGPRGRVHTRGGRPPVVVTHEQDKIEKDGDRRIVFLARTNDDIDGFNFKVDKSVTSLRLMLEIEGKPMPQHVEIGKNNQKATKLPLVVQLN
jgi:hypothetical protein